MWFTRRAFLIAASVSLCRGATPLQAAEAPDPTMLQAGDFLWPKKPGAFIPFQNDVSESSEANRHRWYKEKADFIKRTRSSDGAAADQLLSEIEDLSYNEFFARSIGGFDPDIITDYSYDRIAWVGHIAIVDVDAEQNTWIIQAMPKVGVERVLYSKWKENRSLELIWHGRVKRMDSISRAKIADHARIFEKHKYDFWNFDLSDTSSFYCSKLAWLSTVKAGQIALDGNLNPKRRFWLTPLQVLHSPHVELLSRPRDYRLE